MASENEAVIACAGSGKTTYLIRRALEDPSKQVLIVTYTNENLREINSLLWEKAEGRHAHVETMTVFEFLLRECVKPYQTYKTGIAQIRSINFTSQRPRYAKKTDFEKSFLDRSNNVYRDAVSDLACILDAASDGKVVARLEAIYDKILIDEMQDLAGWDLDFVRLLLASSIEVTLVGDPRQSVYSTNQSSKNKNKRGSNIVDWINAREKTDECRKTEHTISHRCVQAICDFADSLFPSLPATTSKNTKRTQHDGVFLVAEADLDAYRTAFDPQELRWDKRSKTAGLQARNFGQVKGLSFTRVLIHPTARIMEYIEGGSALADGAVSKFYVAVTRGRQSVAIVTSKTTTNSGLAFWTPEDTTP